MDKRHIIARFLVNSEHAGEHDRGSSVNVKYDGVFYTIPEYDKADYEALYDMLPDWRDAKELPKEEYLKCFVLRKAGGKMFMDNATWFSRCADMPLPNEWSGKGFYRNIGGTMVRITVYGWVPAGGES